MISRTRATPSVTAENGSKWRAVWFAMMRASVVFPDPGGPQRMQDPISPRRISSPRAFPGPSRCSWPRNSSRVRGRRRAASGLGERGNRVGSDTDALSGNGKGETGNVVAQKGAVRHSMGDDASPMAGYVPGMRQLESLDAWRTGQDLAEAAYR